MYQHKDHTILLQTVFFYVLIYWNARFMKKIRFRFSAWNSIIKCILHNQT